MDVADLDRAMFRRDAQVRADSGGVAAFVEESEEERIEAGGVALKAGAPFTDVCRRIGGQIGETGGGRGRGEESVGVLCGVKRLDGAVAAAEAAALGQRAWLPVRQGAAGWL